MSHENYLTVEEVSLRIHLGVGTIRNRLSRGDPMPPTIKVGKRRLFPESALNQWMEERIISNDIHSPNR